MTNLTTTRTFTHLLATLLKGAITCVSKDTTLPVLNAVFLEWEGRKITVASTDRYRLIAGECEDAHFDMGTGSVLIPVKEAKALLSAIKNIHEQVEITVDTYSASFDWGTGRMTVGTLDGSFPKWRSLIPTAEPALEAGTFTCNATLLATLKDIPVDRNRPWTLTFTDPMKPMLAICPAPEATEIGWQFLLMPVRITAGASYYRAA